MRGWLWGKGPLSLRWQASQQPCTGRWALPAAYLHPKGRPVGGEGIQEVQIQGFGGTILRKTVVIYS